MLKGIDVSQWQGNINYDTLKPQIDFVIIKATEGNGLTDSQFYQNKAEAVRTGIPHGYYHFARPDLGNTPEAEADYFLSVCQPGVGTILFLDFEVNYSNPVAWCKAWLDRVSAGLMGYKPLIYLNLDLTKKYDWAPVYSDNYGLWLADYNFNTDPVGTAWPTLAFKQWESSESLNGITGTVDADVFYGDLTALQAYAYHGTIVPVPNPSDDETRALSVLKSHFAASTDRNNQPFGNLEGYANTLSQDSYQSWKNEPNLAAKIDQLTITSNQQVHTITDLQNQLTQCQQSSQQVFKTYLGKLFYDWAKSWG